MVRVAGHNPIYRRLTRNSRPPSLQSTLWIAGILCLGSALLATFNLLNDLGIFSAIRHAEFTSLRYRFLVRNPLIHPLFVGGWALTLLTPVIVASLAAWTTRAAFDEESLHLIRLTGFPAGRLVNALLGASLFRARLILLSVLALTPFMLAGLIYPSALMNTGYNASVIAIRTLKIRQTYMPPERFGLFILIALAIWSLIPLGATLGSLASLRLRRRVSLSAAPVTVLMLETLAVTALLIPLLPKGAAPPPWFSMLAPDSALTALGLGVIILSLGTSAGLVAWSRRWI